MNEAVVLTPERILEVTEDVLRRYRAGQGDRRRCRPRAGRQPWQRLPAFSEQGLAARCGGEALARPRQRAAGQDCEGAGPAPARLERWLRALFAAKYTKVCDDPEMFATYLALAQEARDVVKAHKEHLAGQIEHILSDGVEQGAFELADVKTSARAIFDATVRYHHPAPCRGMERSGAVAARIDALLALLLKGLKRRSASCVIPSAPSANPECRSAARSSIPGSLASARAGMPRPELRRFAARRRGGIADRRDIGLYDCIVPPLNTAEPATNCISARGNDKPVRVLRG